MSEIDIAYNKVLPYLLQIFNIKMDNIQGYGRVPIQIGSTMTWADFIINYFDKNQQRRPFCVVEVKECSDEDTSFAVPQAESYAQRINSPYFCCTNGNVYLWFMTGKSQGNSLPLSSHPTPPACEYMKKPKGIYTSAYLIEAINNFESNINNKRRMYKDSRWHNDTTNELNILLETKLSFKKDVIQGLKDKTMNSRGKSELIKNIDRNYDKFISLIRYLKNENIPIESRIGNSIGKNSKYGIDNGGLFFISQLIAALFPNEYTVIQDNAIKGMKRFNLTDVDLKGDSTKEYLFFNQICVELFPLFKNESNFNLSFVHNFFWHYEKDYLPNNSWE